MDAALVIDWPRIVLGVHMRGTFAAGIAWALAACANSLLGTVPAGGECARNADCLAGLVCYAGRCAAPAAACDDGAIRCQGDDAETCRAAEGWRVTATCATRCAGGACVDPVCTPNQRACDADGKTLLACNARGTERNIVAFCPYGCDAASRTCANPVCQPFAPRCSGNDVEFCNATGTGIDPSRTVSCTGGCFNGSCVTGPCADGQKRCNGPLVEQCAGGVWQFKESCAAVCVAGACTACVPGATRCAGDVVERCKADGSGFAADQTCAVACVGGACATCKPGAARCAATSSGVEVCAADGSGYAFAVYCAFGCDAATAKCQAPACSPLATRCKDAATLESCKVDGSGWAATACGSGTACDSGACRAVVCAAGNARCLDVLTLATCNATGTAYSNSNCGSTEACAQGACKTVVCVANTPTCADASTVALCNASGTGTITITCSSGQTCVGGACTGTACTHGSRRCNGSDVEVCRADGSGFDYLQSCISGCRSGVCAGAACRPFALAATPASLPADGTSTGLVASGDIADADGVLVPDGTLFTVEATSGAIAAADADGASAGMQVRSFKGRVDLAVRSAAAAGTAQVSAKQVTASACSGTVSVAFATAGATRIVAEDLTGVSGNDASQTTILWDTNLGFARGNMAAVFGNGEDGDIVASSTNLSTDAHPGRVFPDAVEYGFKSISGSTATLTSIPFGIGPGDDVVLINLGGSTASAGNYEVLPVASVDTTNGSVAFTRAVTRTYGNGNNSDFAGQSAFLRRVPRYRDVVIKGSLRANSGFVFFKASRSVSVSGGDITLSGYGYPGGQGYQGSSYGGSPQASCSPNLGGGGAGSGVGNPGTASGGCGCCPCTCSMTGTSCTVGYNSGGGGGGGHAAAGGNGACAGGSGYGDTFLSRWFKGSGGGGGPCTTQQYCGCCLSYCSCVQGGYGGGIVVVWAPSIAVSGTVAADGGGAGSGGGGGAGGTVYLRGQNLVVGTNLVRAVAGSAGTPGGAGAPGRIRLDGVVTGTTNPAATNQPPVTATLRSLDVDAASLGIKEATILSAIADAAGGTASYFLSNDGGQNWLAATVGTAVAFANPSASALRWRADFAGADPTSVTLSGVAIAYATP